MVKRKVFNTACAFTQSPYWKGEKGASLRLLTSETPLPAASACPDPSNKMSSCLLTSLSLSRGSWNLTYSLRWDLRPYFNGQARRFSNSISTLPYCMLFIYENHSLLLVCFLLQSRPILSGPDGHGMPGDAWDGVLWALCHPHMKDAQGPSHQLSKCVSLSSLPAALRTPGKMQSWTITNPGEDHQGWHSKSLITNSWESNDSSRVASKYCLQSQIWHYPGTCW